MIQPEPHLIVGCCFADLMDPYELVPSLIHRFLSTNINKSSTNNIQPQDCLCYFPITFAGVTQFVPPQPFEITTTTSSSNINSIPSDTIAFQLYSHVLQQQMGHSLDPQRLRQAVHDFGGSELSFGPSDWDICPNRHLYLWQTMLYFFERVAGPELLKYGWDAFGWLHRSRCRPRTKRRKGEAETENIKLAKYPRIVVSNVDLLFRLPRLGGMTPSSTLTFLKGEMATDDDNFKDTETEEIEFTGPYKVSTKRKPARALEPHEVMSKEFELIFFLMIVWMYVGSLRILIGRGLTFSTNTYYFPLLCI